jgi:hypothetical protein
VNGLKPGFGGDDGKRIAAEGPGATPRLRSSRQGRWPSKTVCVTSIWLSVREAAANTRSSGERAPRGATLRQRNHYTGMTMRRLCPGSIPSVLLRMTIFTAPLLGPLRANAGDTQIDGAAEPATAPATQETPPKDRFPRPLSKSCKF